MFRSINFSQLMMEVDAACEGQEEHSSTESRCDNTLSDSSKLQSILQKVKVYHNSCKDTSLASDEEKEVTDAKFESYLLSCTSDDQKRTKNR